MLNKLKLYLLCKIKECVFEIIYVNKINIVVIIKIELWMYKGLMNMCVIK